MTALSRALGAPAKSSTGRAAIPSIWRGSIVETYSDGMVSALVPSLLGDQAVRVPCVVPGLVPGARVLVAAIEGRIDDLIVITVG